MDRIKTVYYADFYDDETGALFASYQFRTFEMAKEFVDEKIKKNCVEAVEPTIIFAPTPEHPEGTCISGRVGMMGVNQYNTCIRTVNL